MFKVDSMDRGVNQQATFTSKLKSNMSKRFDIISNEMEEFKLRVYKNLFCTMDDLTSYVKFMLEWEIDLPSRLLHILSDSYDQRITPNLLTLLTNVLKSTSNYQRQRQPQRNYI